LHRLGYTFRVTLFMWLLVVGLIAGIAYALWHALRRYRERERAAQARMASFLVQVAPSTVAKPEAPSQAVLPAITKQPEDALAQQKLLFEAASKAGEAGEAALSIQLYARLLARYPAGALAEQARAGVEAQRRKLSKS
jgi:hypothetical protein